MGGQASDYAVTGVPVPLTIKQFLRIPARATLPRGRPEWILPNRLPTCTNRRLSGREFDKLSPGESYIIV